MTDVADVLVGKVFVKILGQEPFWGGKLFAINGFCVPRMLGTSLGQAWDKRFEQRQNRIFAASEKYGKF